MTHQISNIDRERLAAEIAKLSSLDPRELKDRWKDLYGTEPPAKISRDLMRRAIAYRLQERAFGGLKPATLRLLDRAAEDAYARRPIDTGQVRVIKPGTALIREWNGATHQVTVLEEGVSYQNKRYHSLSEVARAITGSRWSGPLFFGLKGRTKEVRSGSR
jgi:hypothetical protein